MTLDLTAAVHEPGGYRVDEDALRQALSAAGIRHVASGADVPLHVDPIPRVIDGDEWDALAAGLAQRVRALELFLRDPSVAVNAGVVPASVVETSIYRAVLPPSPVPLGVAGPDVVRGANGQFVVLEDNLRTPTLMGYAHAVRRCVQAVLPIPAAVRAETRLITVLLDVLTAAAPHVTDPVVAVLGDLRGSNVRWEPDYLATEMRLPAVALTDLRRSGDRLLLPDGRPVDVLWRRTSEERLHDDSGRPNALGEALLPSLHAGKVAVVNPFGTGIGDDKRTYPHVEDLVRLHLGEEPLVRSVQAYDLGDPTQLRLVADRLDELVLKPRWGSGGRGVTVMPLEPGVVRDRVLREVRAHPAGWVAQEPVLLSTCPTVVDGAVVPRHVDLRPCILSDGAQVTVLAGGLTRVARDGGLVVNLSQGGAAKDTWVLDDDAAQRKAPRPTLRQ